MAWRMTESYIFSSSASPDPKVSRESCSWAITSAVSRPLSMSMIWSDLKSSFTAITVSITAHSSSFASTFFFGFKQLSQLPQLSSL